MKFEVGTRVFIRTVAYYYLGEVTEVSEDSVMLKDAYWIPNTGKFGNFLMEGKPELKEKYPMPVTLNSRLFTDWVVWPHDISNL